MRDTLNLIFLQAFCSLGLQSFSEYLHKGEGTIKLGLNTEHHPKCCSGYGPISTNERQMLEKGTQEIWYNPSLVYSLSQYSLNQ